MPDAASVREGVTGKPQPAPVKEVEDYTRAILNILEDSSMEKEYLENAQHAILNILEDSAQEKFQMEEAQRAVINILDDISLEKEQFEDTQRALANILDDSMEERGRLEENQRAMLNLLEDFDQERLRAEAANQELLEAVESLRKAKEATDAANRELEAFSYSVSHDLRTPLQSIDGFSLALLEDYGETLDDRGKDYLRRVRVATQRMAQLIDDLLKLSRLTRSELNPVQADLSALAWRVANELQNRAPEREVTWRIRGGLTATGDADLLKVLFENLLGNAWKFTGMNPEATIEFGAESIGGTTAYFVRDNGTGFDMSYADKLFAPFQRLHLEKDFPGTGIGLSIVQRIVHRHNGKIWAEAAIGKGATFFFTLNLNPTSQG
jgi:signal transduction histidine kinase